MAHRIATAMCHAARPHALYAGMALHTAQWKLR